MTRSVPLYICVFAAGWVLGCDQAELEAATAVGGEVEAAEEGNPWIRQAQAAHALADSARGRSAAPGNHNRQAEEALLAFVAADVPVEIHEDDRVRLVLDAYYRLSYLALERGEPEAALEYSDSGLATVSGPIDGPGRVFVANLLVTKGHALERLSREVEATEPYFEALEINRELLTETLEGSP